MLLYEYDMGSTTFIQIKIVKILDEDPPSKKFFIDIIHENKPFDYKCNSCTSKAIYIEEEVLKCKQCLDDYEIASIIYNSPRMGVCGFHASSSR